MTTRKSNKELEYNIIPDEHDIIRRWFQAVYEVVMPENNYGSFKNFCDENKLDASNMRRFIKEPHRQFNLHLLKTLVVKYGISSHWLITGEGEMKADSYA